MSENFAGGSISGVAFARLIDVSSDRINLTSFSVFAPWRIRRRGVETRFVIGDAGVEIDQNLASKIGLAMRWLDEVKAGASIKAIAAREGVTRQRVGQVLRLACWIPA